MPGILAYGSYLPYYRLARSEIGAALGTTAGPGARAVAGYDEDTTSMAVEAGRAALAAAGPDSAPEVVYFATADPAYADKTNATAIHAALGLDQAALAVDMAGAVRSGVGALRARAEALVADEVTPAVGSTGTAQGPLALAATMDRARPGQVIAVITLADGADVQLWRTTEALTAYQNGRRRVTVADQLASGQGQVSYPTFLTWRGQLRREPPRRPDPEAPSAPVSHRHEDWKFAFTASRCVACGARHLPPSRVCVKCHAVDQMVPERLADVPGTVVTFTVDRLAFSLSPPVVVVVVDFDQGGRLQCEMTDVDPTKVKVGDRVEMTFRRLFTAGDVHNYFWKARPLAAAVEKGA